MQEMQSISTYYLLVQAKNFLSAVYNEGVPYDSLLAGQLSKPPQPYFLFMLRGAWVDGPLACYHMGEARCKLDS